MIDVIEEILKSSVRHRLKVNQIDLSTCTQSTGDNGLDSCYGLIFLLPLDADGARPSEQLCDIATDVCYLLGDTGKQRIPLAVVGSMSLFYIAVSEFKVAHPEDFIMVNVLIHCIKAGNIHQTNDKKEPASAVLHDGVVLVSLVRLGVILLHIGRALAAADTYKDILYFFVLFLADQLPRFISASHHSKQLGIKHDHMFTGVTDDTVDALDAKFPNEQWARSIGIAVVGEDGVEAAINGGGAQQRWGGGAEGEDYYCRPLLFYCTGTGRQHWGNMRILTGSSKVPNVK